MRYLPMCILFVLAWPAAAQGPLPFDAWPDHAQAWTDTVLEDQGKAWSEETGMLGKGVRGTAFHAAGLALRGRPEDRDRIGRAVAGVIAQQYDTPGKPWHGTYKRSTAEPGPPEEMWKTWADFDPNWREFVGLSLILVLESTGDELDPVLVTRIRDSLRLACEGAHARAVRWSYTNIALMSAYLLVWGGREFNEPAWSAHGESLAREIFAEFSKHETFREYNSPTYNGVNFFALGMWRRLPVFHGMQHMGETMNAGLWRDVGRFYHANLRNLCGPYDRSYGMDMQRYVAITGIAIDLATGTRAAIPPLDLPAGKSSELAYLPLLAAMGMQAPGDALINLRGFVAPRAFTRTMVEGAHERMAYAWLDNHWMIGIETNVRGVKTSDQYHPITAHWRNEAGDFCWLRLIGDAPINVSLGKDDTPAAQVTLRFADKKPALTFEVHAPGVEEAHFGSDSWSLPGMNVALTPGTFTPHVDGRRNTYRIQFTPAGDEPEATLGIALMPPRR